MKEEKFDVIGMTCSACVANVEKTVSKVPGVKKVQVNLLSNSMVVEIDDEVANSVQVEDAVRKAGYEAHAKAAVHYGVETPASDNRARDEEMNMLHRWRDSLYFLIPLLYFSMADMLGLPLPSALDPHRHLLTMALVQFMLALPVYWFNRKYFTVGFKTLFRGAPNMDSLIAIGASAAFVYGLFLVFRMSQSLENGLFSEMHNWRHSLYFESGATILTLITVGKYLEAKSKNRTSSAIEGLLALKPKSAILLKDEAEVEIPVEEIKPGDLLVIRSGVQIPVDGVIVKGNGDLDESALTGESMPVFKEEGAEVLSATHLKSGYLIMKASRVGENTSLSQIIRLVEEAANSKAPVSRMADRISGIFVPIVIGIALVSFIVWYLMGSTFDFALSMAIAVLVISCPCALGLATPVAIMVGTGKAASLGVLFKNATAIEISSRIDTVVFDKTGTLTHGKPVLTDMFGGKFFPENKLLEIAASLEKASEHVLADAILKEAEKRQIDLLPVNNVQIIPGKGMKGDISGKTYWIGNRKLMEDQQLELKQFTDRSVALAQKGKTVLFVSSYSEILGIIAVADTLKENSKTLVANLKASGKHVVMLTGDHALTAKYIQDEVGIDEMIADVLPGEKESVIRKLQEEGRKVAMVGDGINDAPALTRADIGIAVGGGTDIAMDSADIVLLHHQLDDVQTAFDLSVSVMKHIRQNLFWAFFYNVMGIPLAAGVFYLSMGLKLNPMFAAAAMSLSSVTVVLNALRINQFKKRAMTGNKNSPEKIDPVDPSSKEDDQIQEHEANEGEKVAPQSFHKEIQYTIHKNDILKPGLDKSSLKFVKPTNNNNMSQKKMIVEGMSCGHCQMRVEKALNGLEGVQAKVDLSTKTASVEIQGAVNEETLRKAVEDAGYEVSSIS